MDIVQDDVQSESGLEDVVGFRRVGNGAGVRAYSLSRGCRSWQGKAGGKEWV